MSKIKEGLTDINFISTENVKNITTFVNDTIIKNSDRYTEKGCVLDKNGKLIFFSENRGFRELKPLSDYFMIFEDYKLENVTTDIFYKNYPLRSMYMDDKEVLVDTIINNTENFIRSSLDKESPYSNYIDIPYDLSLIVRTIYYYIRSLSNSDGISRNSLTVIHELLSEVAKHEYKDGYPLTKFNTDNITDPVLDVLQMQFEFTKNINDNDEWIKECLYHLLSDVYRFQTHKYYSSLMMMTFITRIL